MSRSRGARPAMSCLAALFVVVTLGVVGALGFVLLERIIATIV